jgi:hypothetical protein
MISTNRSIVYYVEDKLVETKNTKKSYEDCMDKIQNVRKLQIEYDKLSIEYLNLKREYESMELKFNLYRSKYKYEHRFFNKKIEVNDARNYE